MIIRLVAGMALISSNAFFVASEFALTRLRQLPESEFQEDPSLRRAWDMTRELEIYLTGCQVGITISSILLGVVAEPAVTAVLSPLVEWAGIGAGERHLISIVIAVLIINLAHTVYGEQVPTYLGVERPRFGARYLAPALYWWTRIMYPAIKAGDLLAKASLRLFGIEMTRSWTEEEGGEVEAKSIKSRGELRRQIGQLLTRGDLPEDRRREVLRALEIGSLPVREIMTPIEKVAVLLRDWSADRVVEAVGEGQYVRYPLMDEEGHGFEGVIYVPQLLARLDDLRDGRLTLSDLATPVVRVGVDWPVARVIDHLQERKQELALVEDDSEVVGMVTVTDTFEAIAGDLMDPFDVA